MRGVALSGLGYIFENRDMAERGESIKSITTINHKRICNSHSGSAKVG